MYNAADQEQYQYGFRDAHKIISF